MIYLTQEDVAALIADYDLGPVRDLGLLGSAVARPQVSAFGEDAYPTLVEKAGALMHSLAKNHALVDGNKRLAWYATATFLAVNGYDIALTDEQAYDLVVAVAAGALNSPSAIATRLPLQRLDDAREW